MVAKKISLVIATLLFAMIGIIKGRVLKQSIVSNGARTLFIGLSAALISYSVGKFITHVY
jgi:VIT1/CCC1 family predicted Fe2+/Mn2+ transporter